MFQNLAIFEKTYELILWLYPTVNKFPKTQRFVLGQHIENTILKILEGIVEANQERNKFIYLRKISVKLDKLRILIRLSKDLKFISIRQYSFVVEKVNEIGKMLGGWIKSCKAQKKGHLSGFSSASLQEQTGIKSKNAVSNAAAIGTMA